MNSQLRDSQYSHSAINSQQEKQISRDFKGIWIPREVWLDTRLNYFEKCLLAEIHSLDGEHGCYASNEYLANFFNERERKIQDGLAKLKSIGYIWTESFDGRTRILRTNLTPKNDKSLFSTPEMSNSAPLPCQKSTPLPCRKSTSPHYIERKVEGILQREASKLAFDKFGSFVQLSKEQYQKLILDNGKALVDEIILEVNDYCANSKEQGYKDYSAAIRNFIRRQKKKFPQKAINENPQVIARKRQNDDYITANGSPNDNPNIRDFSKSG